MFSEFLRNSGGLGVDLVVVWVDLVVEIVLMIGFGIEVSGFGC